MSMRFCNLRIVWLLLFATLASGCGLNGLKIDGNPLLNGIGSDVLVDDTVERAKLQDQYFGLMCTRSINTYVRGATENQTCRYNDAGQGQFAWADVVYASLNDVDERCNTYLDSLDAAKQNRDAYLSQLKSTTTTANVIIALTGGVGPQALALVQAAFGLAQQSLENYYSRLILQAEQSSVRRLVLKRQTDYRRALYGGQKGNRLIEIVDNRPAAYLVIRGYLRLCLPATIEARINSAIDQIPITGGGNVVVGVVEAPAQESVQSAPAAHRSSAGSSPGPTPKQATSVYSDPDLQVLKTMRRQ